VGVWDFSKFLPVIASIGGGVVVPPRTARWRLNEAAASDDFADAIGSRHLTQTNSPGVGGTYRTFDGTQYGRRATAGDPTLGLVSLPYTLFAHFRTESPVADGHTCQVVNLREGGSATGALTFILRRESNILKFYHGNGAGAFNVTTLATLADATEYKVMVRLPVAGGSTLTWTTDGTNWTTWNSGQAGTTVAPAGFYFGIGGDVLELWEDRICDVSLWAGTVLTDEEAAAVFAEGD
jgi:hypothetical protein